MTLPPDNCSISPAPTRSIQLFNDLNAEIEIRNQARVHLWYGEHFGRPYPQL